MSSQNKTRGDGSDDESQAESDDEERPTTPDQEELNQSDNEDDTPDVEMNWNLMKFLPEAGACQTNFNMIIAGYILAVCQYQQDEQRRLTPGNTPVRRRGGSQMSQTPIDGHVTPGMVEYCQRLIRDDMCQQMFSITQKIQKKLAGSYGNANDLSSEFPVLPGSHLPLKHPALEFVKDVCQVLSLDTNINNQVTKMKRDLLKLIGVGDFSEEAQFVDPCLSYVLPEVICKACNHIRDLDLCRDPYLTYDTGTQAMWSCIQCKSEYDLDEIEQSLIDAVQRKSMAFVLQDLKCTKCNGIKETNLAKHCKCAGDFTTILSIDDFGQKLQTFRNIARHYNMTLLGETVDWILQMNPQITTVH